MINGDCQLALLGAPKSHTSKVNSSTRKSGEILQDCLLAHRPFRRNVGETPIVLFASAGFQAEEGRSPCCPCWWVQGLARDSANQMFQASLSCRFMRNSSCHARLLQVTYHKMFSDTVMRCFQTKSFSNIIRTGLLQTYVKKKTRS